MIINKNYLRQYFMILQENLKLNIELFNSGSDKEDLNIDNEEFLDNETDDNLLMNNEKTHSSEYNDEDYDIHASDNYRNTINKKFRDGNDEFENNDNDLTISTDDDYQDDKFLK